VAARKPRPQSLCHVGTLDQSQRGQALAPRCSTQSAGETQPLRERTLEAGQCVIDGDEEAQRPCDCRGRAPRRTKQRFCRTFLGPAAPATFVPSCARLVNRHDRSHEAHPIRSPSLGDHRALEPGRPRPLCSLQQPPIPKPRRDSCLGDHLWPWWPDPGLYSRAPSAPTSILPRRSRLGGTAEANVQQRLRWISVGGWQLDIRVYFGKQRPSHSLVATAQQELNRLRLPGQ
jgi:hypothetical protein